MKYTANIGNQVADFPSWDEAASWLIANDDGVNAMLLNGDRHKLHGRALVNDEPELRVPTNPATYADKGEDL